MTDDFVGVLWEQFAGSNGSIKIECSKISQDHLLHYQCILSALLRKTTEWGFGQNYWGS